MSNQINIRLKPDLQNIVSKRSEEIAVTTTQQVIYSILRDYGRLRGWINSNSKNRQHQNTPEEVVA